MSSTLSDIHLIEKIRQGDEKAFELLYDKYSSAIYGVLLKILNDEEIANDILQDTFVKVWTRMHDYKAEKGSIFTWILNIARNRAIDTLRSKRNTNEIRTSLSIVHTQTGASVKMNVDAIGLKEVLETLPEDQREILFLSYFQGYTQEEIAEIMQMPLGTVKTKMRTAMQELKKRVL